MPQSSLKFQLQRVGVHSDRLKADAIQAECGSKKVELSGLLGVAELTVQFEIWKTSRSWAGGAHCFHAVVVQAIVSTIDLYKGRVDVRVVVAHLMVEASYGVPPRITRFSQGENVFVVHCPCLS